MGFAKSLLFNKLKVKIGYKIGVLKIIVRKRFIRTSVLKTTRSCKLHMVVNIGVHPMLKDCVYCFFVSYMIRKLHKS